MFVYDISNISSQETLSLIRTICGKHKKIVAKYRKYANKMKIKDPLIPINMCLIFDDCAFDSKIMKSNIMKELHYNGRHCGVGIFYCWQYLIDIPSYIRPNIDFFITFSSDSNVNKKKLFSHYFGIFDDFKTFCDILSRSTENYGCLISKRCGKKTKDISDSIFNYKASIRTKKLQLGNPFYHKLNDRLKYMKNNKESKPS
jgi:hypothetical protein